VTTDGPPSGHGPEQAPPSAGDTGTATRVRPAARARPSSVSRSATVTALSQAVLPLTALASGPILARALGPEGRGEMAAVLAPIFVASFVASLAVPDATTYVISHLRVPLRRAAAAATALLLLNGAVATAALYFAAPLLLAAAPDAVPTFRMAVFALPLLMVAVMQRAAVSGDRQYGRVSLERVTAAVLRLALIVGLAVVGALTATTAVWCNIGSGLLAALLLLVTILRRGVDADASPLHGAALRRRLVGFGLRGSGGVFANLVSYRLDMAVLPAFVGTASLGFYAVAVSLAEIPALMLGATRSVVFAEASSRDDVRLVARAARVLLAVSVIVAAAMVLLAPYAIRLLFGEAFAPAADLAQILIIAGVPFTAELILGAGLLALGLSGLRSVGQVAAAGLTVIGLVVAVPALGTLGAALTSLVAYTVNYLLTLALFSRRSGVAVRECVLPARADGVWLRSVVARAVSRRRRTT
jgi:O-antigen/teichoic acid export membrane protein